MGTIAVYVDADAMPRDAMKTIQAVGQRYGAHITTVSSINHHLDGEHHIVVDAHSQAADMRIVSLVNPGEATVVVTQDYGLASLVLGKRARALSPTGLVYTEQNIDQLLYQRAFSAHARRAGQRTRGPRPRSEEDKQNFARAFEQILMELAQTQS
ncbi:DUF188 domain-containing protein [Alicyclobacillus tolerans]|uniref:YaiI/YqxD family protein n=1 Tax=Alicyclobacillus tolerans TaxID=90970 RepID=UPI001F38DDE0|nr:DUF188 domain-containing protein [Alicyclobacillus tolerans]MCF8568399.1 DUF188 domain-containing protein [Alicyclobacillus tolerans]